MKEFCAIGKIFELALLLSFHCQKLLVEERFLEHYQDRLILFQETDHMVEASLSSDSNFDLVAS